MASLLTSLPMVSSQNLFGCASQTMKHFCMVVLSFNTMRSPFMYVNCSMYSPNDIPKKSLALFVSLRSAVSGCMMFAKS